MLKIDTINTFYGHVQVLKDISLEVHEGEIVTIIGANGAGKTTLLKTVHGMLKVRSGSIHFVDQDITNLSIADRVKLGISQVPEGRQVFPSLSVMDNLLLGTYARTNQDVSKNGKADLDEIFGIFPVLLDRSKQRAGTLSGGEQQMVAIGRALMAKPKLLLMDEPSLGLAPKIIQSIFKVISDLNKNHGLTVLVVEQDAHVALGVAHRGYVLQNGKIVLSGTAGELKKNETVKAIYLGHEANSH